MNIQSFIDRLECIKRVYPTFRYEENIQSFNVWFEDIGDDYCSMGIDISECGNFFYAFDWIKGSGAPVWISKTKLNPGWIRDTFQEMFT